MSNLLTINSSTKRAFLFSSFPDSFKILIRLRRSDTWWVSAQLIHQRINTELPGNRRFLAPRHRFSPTRNSFIDRWTGYQKYALLFVSLSRPLPLFSTLVGGFRTLSSSRKEIREGALFEKEEVFRVPFFPRTRTKHRSISFRKAGEEKNYIDIVLLSLISFFYFQRRAAVPASKKLGTLKYLDAAFGSALELERAQTR